ncbi:MAG TPA: single-stranded-DNA-specific exonuclease RecJ [Anaerolineae bacterium]|nr:single-stranded-DNA-specific exonuclease RecJ [Anaerolineae bacterium]
MKDWIEPQDIEVPDALQSAIGGHPLVAKTLVRRGFAEVEAARAFLDPDCYRPAPPTDLPNVTVAAERLERAIRQGETICVWGDFDVDGQTATTLLVSTLGDLVGRQSAVQRSPQKAIVQATGPSVVYHIPHRQKESHGVNLAVLEQLIVEGVDLVLTCDTGVTAHEPIAYAQAQGVDVVVTDHHDLPPVLPAAHAVVNPKMLPDGHPLRALPGVGCAYKVAEALYSRAGRPQDVARYLDLVALGIVADVAVQTGDTRYLLQRGLEALRHTERLGLRVMMEVAELNPDWLTEEHIGFVLGPRLNALGRLADANVAVELLTTQDVARARILATELEGLNARRKLLCDQVNQAAQAQVERDPSLLEYGALVLSHPSWPAGVIGIVAGRLAERYHRPTVLIATPPGELGRGSARSIPGCDISAAIAAHGDMLESFGGHPMAAGLAIDPERIPEFRRVLSRTVLETWEDPKGFGKPLGSQQIDGYLSLADLSLELVDELERLAPFGPGNRPLTLASRGLVLKSHSPVGRSGEHLQLIVEDEGGTAQQVIWWQGAGSPLPEGRFDLAYVVRASDYRGQRAVQVEWVDARPIEAPAVALRPERPAARVVDYRGVSNPRTLLDRLRAQENVQVWSEAEARAEVAGRDRYELGPSRVLVIWTTSPGPAELQAVLEKVAPETVYLFGIDPGLDHPEKFLKRLAGLIKQALNSSEGRVNVSTLAAATAQRESTVRAGVAWLAARGHVVVLGEEGDEVDLAPGSRMIGAGLPRIVAQLSALLEETAAYRVYFARATVERLM